MQVMETYLFLSLKESMHQTQAFGGQCSCVASVSCAVFFYFSDRLIKTYGHGKCLLVAQVIFAFRLCALSLISYDWAVSKRLILGMHVFHGPSFALFWATSVDALFKQCPKSLEMTCMATLNMFYFVLGPCIGSFVWGYVYEYCGGMTLGFYALAIVAQGYVVRFCWQRSRFLDQALALDDGGRSKGKHDEDCPQELSAAADLPSDGGESSGAGGGGGEGIALTLSPGHSNGMGGGFKSL
jgi:MFS family permease